MEEIRGFSISLPGNGEIGGITLGIELQDRGADDLLFRTDRSVPFRLVNPLYSGMLLKPCDDYRGRMSIAVVAAEADEDTRRRERRDEHWICRRAAAVVIDLHRVHMSNKTSYRGFQIDGVSVVIARQVTACEIGKPRS